MINFAKSDKKMIDLVEENMSINNVKIEKKRNSYLDQSMSYQDINQNLLGQFERKYSITKN